MQSTSTLRSCHSLQLASIQAGAPRKEIRCFFFKHDQRLEVVLLFPQKSETLKGIQAVIYFHKLMIVKPSDTRWLSHECCIKPICGEPPPLLQTLSQLNESSGNGEAYGLYSVLASVLLEVLSAHAFLNLFMQKNIADFSKLPFVLKSILDYLIHQEE